LIGISDSLIRLSIGIECCNDLITDLENGFMAVSNARKGIVEDEEEDGQSPLKKQRTDG